MFCLVIEKEDRSSSKGRNLPRAPVDTGRRRFHSQTVTVHLVSSEAKGSIYILKTATS